MKAHLCVCGEISLGTWQDGGWKSTVDIWQWSSILVLY